MTRSQLQDRIRRDISRSDYAEVPQKLLHNCYRGEKAEVALRNWLEEQGLQIHRDLERLAFIITRQVELNPTIEELVRFEVDKTSRGAQERAVAELTLKNRILTSALRGTVIAAAILLCGLLASLV